MDYFAAASCILVVGWRALCIRIHGQCVYCQRVNECEMGAITKLPGGGKGGRSSSIVVPEISLEEVWYWTWNEGRLEVGKQLDGSGRCA